jgi:hypothetical protein
MLGGSAGSALARFPLKVPQGRHNVAQCGSAGLGVCISQKRKAPSGATQASSTNIADHIPRHAGRVPTLCSFLSTPTTNARTPPLNFSALTRDEGAPCAAVARGVSLVAGRLRPNLPHSERRAMFAPRMLLRGEESLTATCASVNQSTECSTLRETNLTPNELLPPCGSLPRNWFGP